MPDNKPKVSVIMRSYNDIAVIRQTLEAVKSQTYKDFDLWNFDSTSRDGTLEVIREFNREDHIRLNDSATYNPGKVLNEAVQTCSGDIIVFINSDASPTSHDWLEKLIQPFEDPAVGAVYGRQSARPDCRSLFVKDTERAFGDGGVASTWVHFFSMANSAIRREVVEEVPFETRIQYSEDIEWSYRIKRSGKKIVYVPEAEAVHSHNYTIKQSYKRHFGEGVADSWIFREGEVNGSLLRYFIAPAIMEILRDMAWGVRTLSLDAILHSIPLRVTQKWARWRGFRHGKQMYGLE